MSRTTVIALTFKTKTHLQPLQVDKQPFVGQLWIFIGFNLVQLFETTF